ncbi:glycoside hydrolase family 104 protein [Scopulibacillus darangshiensis]|nr:glycoside hydrolase family 104 protein [Scopulibacillus darangshiensis]
MKKKLSDFSPQEIAQMEEAIRNIQNKKSLALFMAGCHELERIAGEDILNEALRKLNK